MNFELFTYHQIFDQTIHIDQTESISIEELKSEIKLESDRILIALQNSTPQMDPAKTQQYIHQHQQAIHIMIERLEETIFDHKEENSRKKIIEILLHSAENLSLDLQKYFPAYFNYQAMLPRSLAQKTSARIDQKATHLIQIISSRKNPKQPINNLENTLKEIMTTHKNTTYGQRDYMESFLDTLREQMEKIEAGIELLDIILRMISLNYNHPLFYEFCCTYFSREVERCEEISAQYTTLNFIKKSINQTSPSNSQKYNPDLPAIQESLLKFIASELDYLNSMDSIGAHLHQHGLLDDRYKVTLTVRQLAIFIHLQVEANIIITETPKLLHEYIAKHYRTNETDRISAKSFKNAYYSASTEDLEKVIDKIVTMLSLAQEKL
ncbi:hypothetical protein [Pedobacter psychrodurus]|uniref:hypothetical protein n=1 Tax=Pedobacter psychrodurus TaxID=2530456 RepID=UPI00292E156D|nr:hypothetical protein [Pedobacter psychrodurus]